MPQACVYICRPLAITLRLPIGYSHPGAGDCKPKQSNTATYIWFSFPPPSISPRPHTPQPLILRKEDAKAEWGVHKVLGGVTPVRKCDEARMVMRKPPNQDTEQDHLLNLSPHQAAMARSLFHGFAHLLARATQNRVWLWLTEEAVS